MAGETVDSPSGNHVGDLFTGGGVTAAALAAYLLYWSFLATCLIFPVKTQAAVGPTLTILPALCGLASCAVSFLIVDRTGKLVGGSSALGPIVADVLLSMPLLCAMALSALDIQASLLMQAACWTAWGIGQAALFPLVGMLHMRADMACANRRTMPMATACTMASVAVFAALALFAPDPFRSFLPMLYFAAVIVLLVACKQKGIVKDLPGTEGQSRDFEPTKSLKALSPLVIGSTFSLVLCYGISRFGMTYTLGVVAIALLLGGGGMAALIAAFHQRLVNSLVERLYFPITAVCFFLLSVVPDQLKAVPTVLICALFFAYACFHWSMLVAFAHRFSITSPLHFATGLLSPAAGLCIGWAISAAFALLGGNLAEPYALFFGWITAYIIVLSIAPYASDPTFEIDMLNPDVQEVDPTDRSGNTWERACAAICEEYKLSPREREVFGMLAHGRNVEYISETLFISGNTAKTHKYRIYRKLGVNTHQELLDKVELFEQKLLT